MPLLAAPKLEAFDRLAPSTDSTVLDDHACQLRHLALLVLVLAVAVAVECRRGGGGRVLARVPVTPLPRAAASVWAWARRWDKRKDRGHGTTHECE
ncbi:hypothetical protein GUJ93_ZPchr0006g43123 [Zizania palustris]|uniref:Uncharacterized protein n=1 Tax=Zizania palustris TaxID=103762 RepID=A0A8J5VNZ9_ZIZPA|nr:hypothetical protein GUJ93_ZPchr0006g43123 [Zizania palustris]